MMNSLSISPFFILGASVLDNRKRLIELADEKSLITDSDVCQKARTDLTNLRSRLGFEIAWMPGVSPEKASEALDILRTDPNKIRDQPDLPKLAHLNLLCAAFELVDDKSEAQSIAKFIIEIAELSEALSVDEVVHEINKDRTVAGFTLVTDRDQVENELTARKRIYRQTLRDGLDRLESSTLVAAMTYALENTTAGGLHSAPGLIDSLVDGYELETKHFLDLEQENIQKLTTAMRSTARVVSVAAEKRLRDYMVTLDKVVRNWVRVAKPVQLSAKARGMDHLPSSEASLPIRLLAVNLFSVEDAVYLSEQIINLLEELFADVPVVQDAIKNDRKNLLSFKYQFRPETVVQANEHPWKDEFACKFQIGAQDNDILSISPQGISWRGQCFAFENIVRVRWGIKRSDSDDDSINVSYMIAFGDANTEAVVNIEEQSIYAEFGQKMWMAMGPRLIDQMLVALGKGKHLNFGNITVYDAGIALNKRKFFKTWRKFFPWKQISIWTDTDVFFIIDNSNKKTICALSYISCNNARILLAVLSSALTVPNIKNLSQLLLKES
jgi:hypothetical protein